jgi:hypothetical protein
VPAVTWVLASAELFAATGSVVGLVTVTVLSWVPTMSAVAVMLYVTVIPGLSGPPTQVTTVDPVQPGAVASVTSGGSVSTTVWPALIDGPRFVTMIV